MVIGVVAPFNPQSIVEYLDAKDVPAINPMATAVNTLVYEMLSQGHIVKIFTTSNKKNNIVLYGRRVEVYIVPKGLFPSLFGAHEFLIGRFFISKRIAKVIKHELKQMEVLHAHWTYEYAYAASSFSDTIPVFDSVRDWCPYQLGIASGLKKLDWMVKYLMFKRVMADNKISFIANSSYTYRRIKECYPDKVVSIIPNPIDKRWIIDNKRKNVKHQIISIAQALCSPRKNISTLLESFAKYKEAHPEAQLHLVGRYEKSNPLYKQWEKRGLLDGVILYGLLSHNELLKLIDKMTFLVHPAVEETFGNILLEAMSRCVPCIGGDHAGAVPEVLGHGKYGVVCDIIRPNSIVEAMNRMNEPAFYQSLLTKATAMLKETYSSDSIVFKHICLFNKKNESKDL